MQARKIPTRFLSFARLPYHQNPTPIFQDFDVGKEYRHRFILTNVSLTFNTFKILNLPDSGECHPFSDFGLTQPAIAPSARIYSSPSRHPFSDVGPTHTPQCVISSTSRMRRLVA